MSHKVSSPKKGIATEENVAKVESMIDQNDANVVVVAIEKDAVDAAIEVIAETRKIQNVEVEVEVAIVMIQAVKRPKIEIAVDMTMILTMAVEAVNALKTEINPIKILVVVTNKVGDA